MRVGSNPTKENNKLEEKFYHRIIMPVYIPNLEGYFSRALEVLEISLESIFNTMHEKTAVTVIDNACCQEVRDRLNKYYKEGLIDQLIINKENHGKIDPLIGAARGTYEPLITITDSDVLFTPGWITEVEKAIDAFPQIGLVSPCPVPKMWNYYTSTTILSNLRKIQSGPLVKKDELMLFPKSVGREDMYNNNPHFLVNQHFLSKNGTKVILGAGHFVATMRREVFDYAPKNPSLKKIVGGSERNYIDIPVDKAGLYRVGLSKIMAHHIGNIPEPWMKHLFEETKSVSKAVPFFEDKIPAGKRNKLLSAFHPNLRQKFIQFLIQLKFFRLIGMKS